MPTALSASQLTNGSFSARWGSWTIAIRGEHETWNARVTSSVHDGSVLIGKRAVFPSAHQAVAWACSVIKRNGGQAFVDGRQELLDKFLAFEPTTTFV